MLYFDEASNRFLSTDYPHKHPAVSINNIGI